MQSASWHAAAFLYIRNHVCIGVSQERSLTHSKQKTQQREEEHFTSKTVQGGRWSSSFVSTWMVRLIKHLKLTGWDSNIITTLASMPRQLLSACLPPRHSLNNDQRQIVWAEPQVTSRAEDVLCWDGRLLKAEETVWLARFVRTRHSLNKHTLDTHSNHHWNLQLAKVVLWKQNRITETSRTSQPLYWQL